MFAQVANGFGEGAALAVPVLAPLMRWLENYPGRLPFEKRR